MLYQHGLCELMQVITVLLMQCKLWMSVAHISVDVCCRTYGDNTGVCPHIFAYFIKLIPWWYVLTTCHLECSLPHILGFLQLRCLDNMGLKGPWGVFVLPGVHKRLWQKKQNGAWHHARTPLKKHSLLFCVSSAIYAASPNEGAVAWAISGQSVYDICPPH